MTTKRFFIIIFLVSFLIRFIYVWKFPPLLWDEASIGYNAYSILQTAKDEYGQILPLVFKSFGDYKPGLYIYATIPFVAIFGLNPLAVRLPSVIAGSLIPILVYLLITTLSPKSKKTALIASILLAFNPWNIHFSRGGWETNFLVFELLFGLVLFLKHRYLASSLLFASTLYTYQAGKIITPLIIIILFITTLRQNIKPILIKFILPLILLSLPIAYGLIFSSDSARLQVFSLWSYHRPSADTSQIISESNNVDYQLFHSEPLFFIRNFFIRYFNHFSFRFLTFEGDWQIGRHSAPYAGVLLYPSVIFMIIGFFYLLSNLNRVNIFFLLWLLVAPLPSALTRDIIQPVRSLSLSIPIIYLVALGISFIFQKIKIISLKSLIIVVYLISFIYYCDLYYQHLVKVKPEHWLYGYQSAINYVQNHPSPNIYITDYYGQPYIYYLFYSQYPPAKYQSQAMLTQTSLDVGRINHLDNITFGSPDFAILRNQPQTLIIMSSDDALRQGIDLTTLTPLSPINGYSTFYAYQTQ